MPTSTGFLYGLGECDEPVPSPDLTRRYRFHSLVVVNPVDGKQVAPPATISSVIGKLVTPTLMLSSETPLQFFGGVPANLLGGEAEAANWSAPLLAHAVIDDIAQLAKTGTVVTEKRTLKVAVPLATLETLSAGGDAIVQVEEGGGRWIRLRPSEKAVLTAPRLQPIVDFEAFFAARAADSIPGTQTPQLSAGQLRDLACGRPVMLGKGRNKVLLMRAATPEAPQAPAGTFSSNTGTVVVVSSPPAPNRQPPPPNGATTTTGNAPPPPLPGTGASAPPPSRSPANVDVALLVPFEQIWTLKSYERGELISSIALTPLEEVTIEVFSWDRRKTSTEDSTSSEAERIAEAQTTDRDTRDVFSELTKNDNFSWGLNASISAGVPGQLGGTLGGNVGNTNSLNDVARNTRQKLQESTVKATEKVKSSRQSKITESVEEGSETRTTRKLRNANQTYPVTYNYFSVMARYGLKTECVKAEVSIVLTVADAGGRLTVDYDFVRLNEPTLRRGLLSGSFAAGFDAARTLWMYERACEESCRRCLCQAKELSSTSPRFVPASSAAQALARAVASMPASSSVLDWRGYFSGIIRIAAANGVHAAVPIGLSWSQMRRVLFIVAIDHLQPGLWSSLHAAAAPIAATTVPPSPAQISALYAPIVTLDPAVLDRALAPDQPLRDVLASFINRLVFAAYQGQAQASLSAFFAAWAVTGTTGNQSFDLTMMAIGTMLPTMSEVQAQGFISSIILLSYAGQPGFSATEDGGVRGLIQPAKDAIQPWIDERATQSQAERSAELAAQAARESAVAAMFPIQKMLAARERFDALKRHIQENNDYYALLLLTERLARGDYIAPPEILQFAPAVQPRPIAVVDGKLCFPINTDFQGMSTLVQRVAALVDAVTNDGREVDVTLPTPGFVVEPKLSMCTAAEPYIEEARRIELEQRQALAIQAGMEAKRRTRLMEGPQPSLEPFDREAAAIKVSLQQQAP